jgi:hypothetical protein
MDAWDFQRRRSVDRDDAPVRHGTAQDHRIDQSIRQEVIEVLATAAQEPKIFPALDGAADEGVLHGFL